MLAAPKTKSFAIFISFVIIDETNEPLPILLNSIASSISLYGIIVATGPKASISWQSVFVNGFSFKNRVGGTNEPLSLLAPIRSKSF